jgi:hypothetical protein
LRAIGAVDESKVHALVKEAELKIDAEHQNLWELGDIIIKLKAEYKLVQRRDMTLKVMASAFRRKKISPQRTTRQRCEI